jgi:penicillin amidase
MKRSKKVFLSIGVFIVALISALGIYLWSTRPQYSGDIQLVGLSAEVKVEFDAYGIPHIQAQNKMDVMRALGYLHAQDRLFQMELMRRVGSGTLSEIVGHDGLKVDVLFRTMELPQYAEQSAERLKDSTSLAYVQEMNAYLEGLNAFIDHGATPVEFHLMGIPKKHFEVKDMFYISGALAFNFNQGQKTEPIIDYISKNYTEHHLKDIALYHDSTESFIPSNNLQGIAEEKAIIDYMFSVTRDSYYPIYPPLDGSNAWAISGKHTKSGKPMFCNDTHIGYMMPQTWYEAHLQCPGFELYGHFLAGVPFALIGRNPNLTWGITMLLNDDMDYFYEKPTADKKGVTVGDKVYPLKLSTEVIHVKGGGDTTITRISGPHGPMINTVNSLLANKNWISCHWTYTQKDNNTFKGFWGMNQSNNMKEFASALPYIHAPGVSLNYADAQGNIAWWATASLKNRLYLDNPWTIADGSQALTLPFRYIDFKYNPSNINPESGIIYSANDWPQEVKLPLHKPFWYPGYYKPQYRADRIMKLLSAQEEWDSEKMKSVLNDVTNDADKVMWYAMKSLAPSSILEKLQTVNEKWQGEYTPSLVTPTIYQTLLYYYMRIAMEDELGPKAWELFCTNHQYQRAYGHLLWQEHSPWWDDVRTPQVENRAMILTKAWQKTWSILTKEYGENPALWKWEESCQLEIGHPIGKVALLAPFFNGPKHPVHGSNETIHQSGFHPDSLGHFKVLFGSQMRIIVDFGDARNGCNVTPSGQSGHWLSQHYDDQQELYAQRCFRNQTMKNQKFEGGTSLVLHP